MNALSVAVFRGDVVEAVHRVHAVAVRDGDPIATAGDAERVAFLRSSWKPIQAIALVESATDLADEEVAIACASHQAEPAQLAAVHRLLDRAGATADELANGPQEGRPEGRVGHNCSGKHAGFLVACRANDWPFAGYHLPDHPLQRRLRDELTGVVAAAADGCGVPTYATTLREAAALLPRTATRIADAMRAHPELVGGRGAHDTALMQALPGWIAKRGAEGLLCAASPDGIGIAVKSEDGSNRPLRPALGWLLERLGVDAGPFFGPIELENSRGERTGRVAVS